MIGIPRTITRSCSEKANVLILIDSFSRRLSFNYQSRTLGRLIELLKTRNPAKIAVAPATMTGIDQVATLRFLGLDDFPFQSVPNPFFLRS